ncbi:MAG: hypothetical protein HYR64_07775 [Fimbriimonas ginsengisoli]|uniref:Guanylate cyclase domain-containing protein n=1 Tax=Fimbriimonas ginsengisoli TaxID=1005039 RepID=A0A931PU26_FIMGI|nr:hypothetical protein [Fimbriimonas ginsengisoli]
MLPSGTVTFLFTDIEGSSARWEREPERMRRALADHNRILDQVAASTGGSVFKTVGDAYCISFANAQPAARAATDAQTQLAAAGDPLRVRMALHTASIEPTGNDYLGQPLNRIARLLSAAHGGQVLASEATRSLLADAPATKDLGFHTLRDLLEPMRIWQLGDGDFPAIKTLDSAPHNLPIQTTSFVGRDEELREIDALVAKSRLVTLTGTGGTGKTRLAVQFAADKVDEFPDGVWFCELAALAEREDVMRALLTGIRAPDSSGAPRDRLMMRLSGKRLLIVLDNCEHVLESASAVVDDVLHNCPSVTILATSREPLGVRGEASYRVPSLPSPGLDRSPSLRELEAYGGTALFLDRLAMAASDVTLSEEDAPVIAKICARLDGIPLAIELAAPRARAMSLQQIESRLDDRFRLLTGGSRTAVSRQQTLGALIDWSVQLLSEEERRFLLNLSVFGGNWDLEGAEAVCIPSDGGHGESALDLLTALVDKSLVVFDSASSRYRLLESTRQYLLEKLQGDPALLDMRDRHAFHYLQMTKGMAEQSKAGELEASTHTLERDYENFRTAVEWSCGDPRHSVLALEALLRAQHAFHSLARPGEFARLAKLVLSRVSPDTEPWLTAHVKILYLAMALLSGDRRAMTPMREGLEHLDEYEPELRSRWESLGGWALYTEGEFDEARRLLEAAVAHTPEESSSLARAAWGSGNLLHFGFIHTNLGSILCLQGDYEGSMRQYQLCLDFRLRGGDTRGVIALYANMALLNVIQGNLRESVECALELNRRSTKSRIYLPAREVTLGTFCHVAVAAGDMILAALVAGGASRTRELSDIKHDPIDRLGDSAMRAQVEGKLPARELEERMREGSSIDWEPWYRAMVDVTVDDVFEGGPKVPFAELIRPPVS